MNLAKSVPRVDLAQLSNGRVPGFFCKIVTKNACRLMAHGNRRETHGAASRTSDGRVRTEVAPGRYRGTLLLLIPPSSRFITGQTIYVDGGRTLV